MSECPPMHFVTDCTDTSAPSASGHGLSGVAKVFSHRQQRVRRRLQQNQVLHAAHLDPACAVGHGAMHELSSAQGAVQPLQSTASHWKSCHKNLIFSTPPIHSSTY